MQFMHMTKEFSKTELIERVSGVTDASDRRSRPSKCSYVVGVGERAYVKAICSQTGEILFGDSQQTPDRGVLGVVRSVIQEVGSARKSDTMHFSLNCTYFEPHPPCSARREVLMHPVIADQTPCDPGSSAQS